MKEVIIIVNLAPCEGSAYGALDAFMHAREFSSLSNGDDCKLPRSVYLGVIEEFTTLDDFRQGLLNALAEDGFSPSALFCGLLNDWLIHNRPAAAGER